MNVGNKSQKRRYKEKMRLFSLAFLCGILIFQQFSYLLSLKWIIVNIGFCIFIWIIAKKFSKYIFLFRLLIGILLGLSWCLGYAHYQLSWKLPTELEGKTVLIQGQIHSLPSFSSHRVYFLFYLNQMTFANKQYPAHALIRLSWQVANPPPLSVGDQWQFSARLKKIHGLQNPNGFDYEAFAFQAGIRATGYIVKSNHNVLINSHWYHEPINRIRQRLKEKMVHALLPSQTSHWIIALALGERESISQDQWQILRNTGTNHLMAIAGLHIGLMAGFIFALVTWIWRRIPIATLILPAQQAGAIAALIMALIYSSLAGFSLPTQRACMMLTVGLIGLLARRYVMAWQAFSVALLGVLLLNPLSVLSESFWLSFVSVAFIIYGMGGRLGQEGAWWKWGRIQWVIALGLIPLGIGLFQQFSLIAFVANSIAIPWVGFLIVPLTLVGCFLLFFSAKLGGGLLLIADKLLSVLWKLLAFFAHLPWASWHWVVPQTSSVIFACLGVAILLLPAGFPGRWLGCIWLLPLIFYHPSIPKLGEAWLTVLEVGQGLAIVVQTHRHILVFDTGPRFSEEYDMGESVVTPFLYSLHAKKIDSLVISHGDNDHIGGANALKNYFTILSTQTSALSQMASFHPTACVRGDTWEWDNVNFKFLYPPMENLNLKNNSSCVLRISIGNKHILLTGDIEKLAENYLLENEVSSLPADILIVPHHGSKTSAVVSFLQQVKPKIAIFSIGYRNRYHFPHQSVIEKYQRLGTTLYDTVQNGAIQFKLSPNQTLSSPSLYRINHFHYWQA